MEKHLTSDRANRHQTLNLEHAKTRRLPLLLQEQRVLRHVIAVKIFAMEPVQSIQAFTSLLP